MKVLTLTNLYPPISVGGYEQICRDVTEAMRGRGHHVRVVTSDWKKAEVGSENDVSRQLRLRSKWDAAADRPQGLSAAIDSAAVQLYNARMMRREIATFEPDVVLVWNALHTGQATLLSTAGAKAVVYYLSDPWLADIVAVNRARGRIARAVHDLGQWALARRVAGIALSNGIFCSHALQDLYSRRGVEFMNPTVIHHGIDPNLFPTQPQHIRHRTSTDPPSILFVGQIVREKGVLTLIRALGLVRQMEGLGNARLTLLGALRHRDYEAEIKREISALGSNTAVTITTRPRAEVAAAYGTHDVLAFTSEWEEPFSLVLLEAMAAGIPVVTTLRGGSREVVRDGANALAFEAGDPADLAAKLATVLTDRALAERLGTAAASEVHNKYTLDRQVDAVVKYLDSLSSH